MKLHVLRNESSDLGIPGIITVLETALSRCSLELPWRNNKTGMSCVRADTYSAIIWRSPTLKRDVIRLEDKWGRKNCLIHNANFAALDNPQTAEVEISQVHGCTAVGDKFGQVKKPGTSNTQFGVMNSVATLELLLKEIGPGPHTVTYEWAPGCTPADLSDLNPLSSGFTN